MARVVEALVAAAAVVALAAVLLPWMIGPRGATGGPEPSTTQTAAFRSTEPTASSAPTATPTQPPAPGLAHGRIWHFAFDYPAAWPLHDGGTANDLVGEPLYKALGTIGAVSESCVRKYAELTVSGKEMSQCKSDWKLTEGSAALTFEWSPWTGDPKNPEPWDLMRAESPTPKGAQLVMVAGVRALYARNLGDTVPIGPTQAEDKKIPAAAEVLTWELVDRFDAFYGFKITAAIRGPNTAGLEAQVQALIASMHYVPAILPLPTDDASKAAALQQFFATLVTSGRALGCFPHTPGVAGKAWITMADTRTLSQPLSVRCTAQIDAAPEQVWRVTLTWQWDAGPDYNAGQAVEVWHETPAMDGAAIDQAGFDTMPYVVPLVPGNG